MNNITIVGRLTRDPVYTPAQDGKSQRSNYTVAVDNRIGDKASFFDCVAFGATADVIDKWTHKGKQVAVKGRFEQGDPYTDKNGNMRRSWSLFTEQIELLGSKSDGGKLAAEDEAPVETDSFTAAEDDIPF